MPDRSRLIAACCIPVVLAASAPQGALAQLRIRSRAVTTAQIIQLRPLVLDTATGAVAAGARRTAAPLVQDLEATAWGFGVPGLRLSAMARLRGSIGSELVWPRAGDHADLLWAYAELERPLWRLRAGRQLRAGAPGFTGFDGASALWRPAGWVRFEAWGGRALATGMFDPGTNAAIAAVDSFLPNRAVLVGGLSAWADVRGAGLNATWQREVTANLDALVSHRAAFSARVPLGSRATLQASTDVDLGSEEWGSARAHLSVRATRALGVDVTAFRHRPYFPLNTIWGAFAPQAHWGARLATDARLSGALSGSVSYTMRRYRPATETTPFLAALEDETHALEVAGRFARPAWQARASWRLTQGYGGARSSGDAGFTWQQGPRWQLGADVSAFQENDQLRVAGGTVFGVGAHARATLGAHSALRARIMQWRHADTRDGNAPDWSQLRALIAFETTFGADADRAARRP